MSAERELYEQAKRELEQEKQLRQYLLDQAARDWLNGPDRNYARIGRKYGLTRMQVRNHVQRKFAQPHSEKSMALDARETDSAIPTVTLQTPNK